MSVWMSTENWRDVLAFSATVSTVLQFLTGSLICREYFKLKSVGDVCWTLWRLKDEILMNFITLQTSSLPFTIGMLSSSLWLRYGTLIEDTTLIVVNSIGASLFTLYSLSFFLFTVKKRKVLQQLMLVLLMITFALGYSYVADSDAEASRLIGEWDWYECLHFKWELWYQISSHDFRASVLLGGRFLVRESTRSAATRHKNTK